MANLVIVDIRTLFIADADVNFWCGCVRMRMSIPYRSTGIPVPAKSRPFQSRPIPVPASEIWPGPGLRIFCEISSNILHRVCTTSPTAIRSVVSFIFTAGRQFFLKIRDPKFMVYHLLTLYYIRYRRVTHFILQYVGCGCSPAHYRDFENISI